ncbi:MAG TPA: ubiquinol-cytochrome C chaperone family protein [Phenylobacterium sp.]|nr:ubiquinol-cytochrome C chaperone family protein [Phenylobacterium sp.]
MILDRLFRPKASQSTGAALYAACVDQARSPGLYADLAVPDTVEGRFEIYTLHVALLLDRLKRQGPRAAEISQALFDAYVRSLDDALREMGVGDLSVGKKMRKLGEAFYGRLKNLESAFEALPQTADLEALLARTVYAGKDAPPTAGLSAYVVARRAALASQDLDAILDGQVTWSAA